MSYELKVINICVKVGDITKLPVELEHCVKPIIALGFLEPHWVGLDARKKEMRRWEAQGCRSFSWCSDF